jgi:hypothetical protein
MRSLMGFGCGTLAALYALACSSSGPAAEATPTPSATATATATAPAAVPSETTPIATQPPLTTTDYDAGLMVPGLDAGIPGQCNVTTGKPNCDTCIKTSCCTQVNACDTDPQCVAIDNCTTLCSQQYAANPQYLQACSNNCYAQSPLGGQKLNAVYQCVQATCLAQCK